MHIEQSQSAQGSSSRAKVESAAMARACRTLTFHRPSLRVRAAAAVVAVVVSSTMMGALVTLYGDPDIAVLTARAAEPEGQFAAMGPRSHIPTRPCLTNSRRCA